MNKLGTIIDTTAERDAIHIAIAPVTAAHALRPGDHIGFISKDTDEVGITELPIGIVDPFLLRSIKPGEQFFILLYPETITGLRHEWTHPAFPNKHTNQKDSMRYLTNLADKMEMSYNALIAALQNWVDHGEIFCDQDEDKSSIFYSHSEVAWHHFTKLTGKHPENIDDVPFTCSC